MRSSMQWSCPVRKSSYSYGMWTQPLFHSAFGSKIHDPKRLPLSLQVAVVARRCCDFLLQLYLINLKCRDFLLWWVYNCAHFLAIVFVREAVLAMIGLKASELSIHLSPRIFYPGVFVSWQSCSQTELPRKRPSASGLLSHSPSRKSSSSPIETVSFRLVRECRGRRW